MDEIEIECQKALYHKGGIMPKEMLMEDHPQLVELCGLYEREINEPGRFRVKIPPVHICILAGKELGACVTKYNGKFFIGISFGTFFILQGLFCHSLASPNVLVEYGDPSQEIQNPKVFNFQITDLYQYVASVADEVVPKGLQRCEMAENFYSYAIHFLVFHELGHALLGHIDFKVASSGESEFADESRVDPPQGKIENHVSQFLELDADTFAIQQSFRNIEGVVNAYGGDQKMKLKLMSIYVCSWAFSVYALCRLFNRFEPDGADLMKSGHPSPGIKQLNLLEVIKQAYQWKSTVKDPLYCSPVRILTLVTLAFREVEAAFSEISEQDFTGEFILYKEHLLRHYKILSGTFKHNQSLIQPYSLLRKQTTTSIQ
jgi:hypothetical protein